MYGSETFDTCFYFFQKTGFTPLLEKVEALIERLERASHQLLWEVKLDDAIA
jgi:hypothetical protein